MDDDSVVQISPVLTARDYVDDWELLKELGELAERYC